MYDGLWKNDETHSVKSDGRTIDNHTEVIEIPNKSFNEVKSFLLPSFLHSLKRIVIGDECFKIGRLFELDGLRELESAVIGQKVVPMPSHWMKFGVLNEAMIPVELRIIHNSNPFTLVIGHSLRMNSVP